MLDRGKDFADLVYQVVITEKRMSAARIAAALGLEYSAFYARIRNRVSFSADEIRALIAILPDPRFAAWLLRGTHYLAAERIDGTLDGASGALHGAATRIVIEAVDVLETVEAALADGRLDHRDIILVRRDIEIAERALATLRQNLRDAAPAASRADL